jgi:ABC-2 type transport system ATP-binding protein
MDAVVLEGVTKRFDTLTAVSNLSLGIREGAVFGLLGPNGAGKTTSLRMIMRVLIPDEGSIQVLGEPVSERTQDLVGYLPEERGLYAKMKVREVLRFLGALKGLSETEAAQRAQSWLERLELAAWSEKKIQDLSKGMQQKVQFIATVIHKPPLNAGLIKDIMLELRDQGSTIILSTHRMEQVEMMCDAICLINKGCNVLNGDLRAIKQSYGKNTLRMEYSGDGDFLEGTGLVEKVNRFGAVVEARLKPGADPQEILKAALLRGVRISRFELVEPPLNDIFIEKVAGANA